MDQKTDTRTTPEAVDLGSGVLLAGSTGGTPQTDAQEYYIDGHYHVSAALARELERENARLRATLKGIRRACTFGDQFKDIAEVCDTALSANAK